MDVVECLGGRRLEAVTVLFADDIQVGVLCRLDHVFHAGGQEAAENMTLGNVRGRVG